MTCANGEKMPRTMKRADELPMPPADQRAAEVEDVLGEGEAAGDRRGVDEAVDRSVEVAAPHPEDEQHAEALGALLDERRLDDRGGEVARRP